MNVDDIFSTDPAVQRRMADEIIENLKVELAKFDATQQPREQHLRDLLQRAREEDDAEEYRDYEYELDEHIHRWREARQPFIMEIQRIALARDGISPREMTFPWAQALFAGVSDDPSSQAISAAATTLR